MTTIDDPGFVTALLELVSLRSGKRQCHVSVSDFGAVGGYQIDICSGTRVLVSVGWSPGLRDTAYVLTGPNPHAIDQERLTELVRSFLERHQCWTTSDQLLNVTFRVIRDLHEAIARQDWPTARHAWALLTPHHPQLIANDPSLAAVTDVLRSLDAVHVSKPSGAVH